jgi:hypothetical protein
MHVSCTLRNCPAHLTHPFSESPVRTSTKRPSLDPYRATFATAQAQPRSTANARSLYITTKLHALRLVAKRRLLKVLQHSYITVENWHTNSNRNSSGAICQGPDFVSDSFEHHESTSAQGQATLAKRQNSEVEKRGSTKATARCRSRNKFRDYSIGCSAALIR